MEKGEGGRGGRLPTLVGDFVEVDPGDGEHHF